MQLDLLKIDTTRGGKWQVFTEEITSPCKDVTEARAFR